MSVVVAHQASVIGHLTLQEAAKEANLRQAPLAVIHVAEGVDLDVVSTLDTELLVIGARRRSPVGKLFLGSVTQNIILHADVPVLVVKAPADSK